MSDVTRDPAGAIGHRFADPALLQAALTHASFAHEQGGTDQERLEFLGDAVLQLCVTEWLYERFGEAREGELSRLRQRLVSTTCLAVLGARLGLGECLRLGAGEAGSGGRSRPRVLAGTVEAVLGAVYLDGGQAAAAACVRAWLADAVEELASAGDGWKDPRSLLQEFLQRDCGQTPIYDVVDTTGPPHERWFSVQVRMADRVLGQGEGRSKREASRRAALDALSARSDP